MRWKFTRLLRPFLQVGLIWIAIGISVSRISDYHHHWSDVLGGAVVGIIGAILTVSKSKKTNIAQVHNFIRKRYSQLTALFPFIRNVSITA